MSCAIATIIYGVPMTPEIFEKLADMNLLENGGGFEILYCAGEGNPGYCGILLSGMDETESYYKLSDLRIKPTEKEIQEFKTKLENLNPEIKNLIKDKPDVYVIWSSS